MGRLMARRRPSRLLRVSLGFAGAVFLAGLLVALSGPSGMSGMDRVVYGLLSAFGVAMVAGRALDGLLAGYSVSVVGFPRSDGRHQLGPGYMFGALMLFSALWLCYLAAGLLVSEPPDPLPDGLDVFYVVVCAVGWLVAVVRSCVAGGLAVASAGVIDDA